MTQEQRDELERKLAVEKFVIMLEDFVRARRVCPGCDMMSEIPPGDYICEGCRKSTGD